MEKSIQDYRNIVKILKLQLLKVREQNSSLSNILGISSEKEHSSFSVKLQKYRDLKKPFAKNFVLFLTFGHKCQIIGITPEMIFRIADKKRDKKVSVVSLNEIIKRLKLRMSEVQISQLLSLITKSTSLFYEQYLQFLSAFQINSEKYPVKGSRTFVQLSLIKFGKQVKEKFFNVDQLYKEINNNQELSDMSIQNLTDFTRKNTPLLKDVEVVAVFVGLDIQSECQIQKSIFKRQMEKVYNLIENGVRIDENEQRDKEGPSMMKKHKDSEDIQMQVDTGVQAGNKKAKKVVNKSPEIKLMKGEDSSKLIGQLKKEKIRVSTLIEKLLERQKKQTLVKPFSLIEFYQTLKSINNDISKKNVLQFFKCLDIQSNGSISTEQLIKLWLRGRQISDTSELLFKILYRHLRQIQFIDPLSRFINLGFKQKDKLSVQIIQSAFINVNLSLDQIKLILSMIGNDITLQQFSKLLKNEGINKSKKIFKKMDQMQYNYFNSLSKKLLSKSKNNFIKLMRLQDGSKLATGQHWQTIFEDQWSCWDYCLQKSHQLTNFWQDHQFGPTKGDKHGYRSILANQSDIPPGLPDQEDIQWVTFQQMLMKQNSAHSQVNFMKNDLQTSDVVQGKLGNCWFVSALSIIARDDEQIRGIQRIKCQKNPINLIFGIHPTMFHQFRKYGMYVFKFYKKFKPIYVIVDGLFPIQSSCAELIFAKSPDKGLQWVAFIEKAYAKLHHSYANLISGDISQGLNDLTNALPIKENLSPNNTECIDKVTKLCKQKQFMGCSITPTRGVGCEQPVQLDGQRCGLFYGHAYSITDYINLRTKDQKVYDLLRVRNPWGHGQWCLDWSDKPIDDDPEYGKLDKYMPDLQKHYQQKIKQAQRLHIQKPEPYQPGDDGQFLISLDNWSSIYSNLFIGLFFRNRQYSCQFITQTWDNKFPSGLCKMKGSTRQEQLNFVKNNYQYVIDVKTPTDILMFLIQQDGRLYRGQKYPYKELCNAVIILVFTLESNQTYLEFFDKSKLLSNNLKLELRRDVDFWHQFQPGKYAIIPTKMKNNITTSDFTMRVYSDKDISFKKVKGNGNNQFRPTQSYHNEQNFSDKATINAILDGIKKYTEN